jgi:hypothetical protein
LGLVSGAHVFKHKYTNTKSLRRRALPAAGKISAARLLCQQLLPLACITWDASQASVQDAIRSIFVDVGGFVGVDAAASPPDIVELDTAVPPSDVEDTLSGSILPSLAQPLTMSPNSTLKNALFDRSILVLRIRKKLFSVRQSRNKGDEVECCDVSIQCKSAEALPYSFQREVDPLDQAAGYDS